MVTCVRFFLTQTLCLPAIRFWHFVKRSFSRSQFKAVDVTANCEQNGADPGLPSVRFTQKHQPSEQ